MNKVVFLDRDGTINVDLGYVHEQDKLEFIPGVLKALKRIQDAGFKLIIVTNQSGIGRGLFTQEEYASFSEVMLSKLNRNGIYIEKIYTCPHTAEDHCECRKPLLGLFEQAIYDFDVDLTNSYAVGDRLRDLTLCNKYSIRGILYSPDIESISIAGKGSDLTDHIVKIENWEKIADYICNKYEYR